MSEILFQSADLNLRRFEVEDAGFIYELLNTPGWKLYIGDRGINTLSDAVNYIVNGPQASYTQHNYGLWLVSLKENNDPIGMCGLIKRDYLEHPDIGFAFLPGYEGRGLAYQAAAATIEYGRADYKIEKLYAVTKDDNLRSQRLLERCGFANSGFITPPGQIELFLYALNVQEEI